MDEKNDSAAPSLDLLAWEGPAVGLLDLDAFFASVEQLDHPEWRGKPVISSFWMTISLPSPRPSAMAGPFSRAFGNSSLSS